MQRAIGQLLRAEKQARASALPAVEPLVNAAIARLVAAGAEARGGGR